MNSNDFLTNTQIDTSKLSRHINTYCHIDDKIHLLNKHTHQLRKKRHTIETEIIYEFNNLNLDTNKFKYGDNMLVLIDTCDKPNITLGMIKEVTLPLLGPDGVTKLLEAIHIYRNNHKKSSYNLKRKKLFSGKKTLRKNIVSSVSPINNKSFHSLKNN